MSFFINSLGPGAGKGTQCEKLSREFGITHLSAGELLRQERLTGSEKGKLIDSYLKDGRIVPVEISLSLLKQEIQRTGHERYLIDGFPRNYDNLNGWLRLMPPVCDIEMIIYISCNEEEMQRRILERGRTSNRNDDNLQTAKKRFVTFQTETLPVVEHFHSMPNVNFINLNGDRSIESIYSDLRMQLLPKLHDEVRTKNTALSHHLLRGDSSDLIQQHLCLDGGLVEVELNVSLARCFCITFFLSLF